MRLQFGKIIFIGFLTSINIKSGVNAIYLEKFVT